MYNRRAHTYIRMICLAHGRPAIISENSSSIAIHMQLHVHPQPDEDNPFPYDEFVARALELCEITHNSAQKYFSSSQSQTLDANRTSVLGSSPTEDKLVLMIQMEGCLRRWENSLPDHLKYESSEPTRDDISTRQATVLHLR